MGNVEEILTVLFCCLQRSESPGVMQHAFRDLSLLLAVFESAG